MQARDRSGRLVPVMDPRLRSGERACAGFVQAEDEELLAVWRSARLDRRYPCERPQLLGDLVLTSRRLVHAGQVVVDIPIDAVQEAALVDGRLLLVVGPGRGITIEVAKPDDLRRRLAEARTGERRAPGEAVER
jgi:hypothetical protein